MYALYDHGGIHLDPDVEVLRSFEPLRRHACVRDRSRDRLPSRSFGRKWRPLFFIRAGLGYSPTLVTIANATILPKEALYS